MAYRINRTFQTQLEEDLQAYLGRVEGIRAHLLAVEILDPRTTNLDDHSNAQFFDILSNQEMQRLEAHLMFPPSKAYERGSQIQLVGHFGVHFGCYNWVL